MSKLLVSPVLRRVPNVDLRSAKSKQSFCKSFLSANTLSKLSKSRLSVGCFRPAQQKTDVLDVKINYELLGTVPHPVVCLPGLLGTIELDFGPVLEKISLDKFTVVAWDPPGYGKSRPPDRDFSGGKKVMLLRDVKYIDGLMKKLGYPKYSILGWSDGAITAIHLASSIPSSVKKLVIWGGFAYISEVDRKIIYPALKDINNWSDTIKDAMVSTYGLQGFQRYWNQFCETFELTYDNKLDVCEEALPKIACPTLIFQGLKDQVSNPDNAEFLHKKIKHSEFYIMKNGKHNLHLQFTEEFLSVAEKFLIE